MNSLLFKNKTAALRKDLADIAELVYISAPHTLTKTGETTFDIKINDLEIDSVEQARAWSKANAAGTHFIGYEETIEYLLRIWIEQGPFDGILGFSQGAAVAAFICIEIMLKNENRTDLKLPNFVMMFSGPMTRSEEHLKKFSTAGLITVRSLTVIGEKDTWVPPEKSRQLAELFKDPKISTHSGGHFIPTDAKHRKLYREWISGYSSSL